MATAANMLKISAGRGAELTFYAKRYGALDRSVHDAKLYMYQVATTEAEHLTRSGPVTNTDQTFTHHLMLIGASSQRSPPITIHHSRSDGTVHVLLLLLLL
eukprot:scpid112696/ scgid26187/ 